MVADSPRYLEGRWSMTTISTEKPAAEPDGSTGRLRNRKVRLSQLVAATYLMVAGGPYGLEEIVGQAGYGGAILILLLTPLFWSVPTALMVSELSSALPESGGYYAWVKRALGPFWGFQEAWLSLAASIFDMAIYPTLFGAYLARLYPALGEGAMPIVVGGSVIAVCTVLNLRGAGVVGMSSVILTFALFFPFAILIGKAAALPAVSGRGPDPGGLDLLGGILIAMWNYMGWDNSSTVAAEVERPERTYPLAMGAAVSLVALTYVLPIAAVRHLGIASSDWTTGSWAGVAGAVGGPWLETAMIVGGMLSALGMLNALIMSYTRIPPVLAQDGFLPAIFACRSARTGAPKVSIVVCAIAWGLALNLGFKRLIEIDLLLYGLSLVLEFAALVALRIREPGLARPYRVPGGLAGAILLGIAPSTLIVLALIRNSGERVGPLSALGFGLVLVAAGCLVYGASRWVAARRSLARLGGVERASVGASEDLMRERQSLPRGGEASVGSDVQQSLDNLLP
jgi:amino acid transporter